MCRYFGCRRSSISPSSSKASRQMRVRISEHARPVAWAIFRHRQAAFSISSPPAQLAIRYRQTMANSLRSGRSASASWAEMGPWALMRS